MCQRLQRDADFIQQTLQPLASIGAYPAVRVSHAATAVCDANLSASPISTSTMRDTPGSLMVTPTNCSPSSIVTLLCVMNRNCVSADILRTRSQKRTVLESSSGESSSSSRQNGAGLSLNSENTSDSAVSAFSPPESSCIDWFFLPGVWPNTCRPASRISSPVSLR